jgi:hypothetical protein
MFACKDKKLTEAQQIVSEWVGKEIRIPDDVRCTVMSKDTSTNTCYALMDAEYKVLLYVDSSGCSSCRLKLFQWEALMSEADSLFHGKLSFLFFFSTKKQKRIDNLIPAGEIQSSCIHRHEERYKPVESFSGKVRVPMFSS